MNQSHNFKDLSGQRFGRLVAIKFLGQDKGQSYWECVCDCGEVCKKRASHIKNGNSKSCGCYNKELGRTKFKTHGLSNHPLRIIHNAMMSRCYNQNQKAYIYYGARGIKVCGRWHIFKNFYDDMINGYEKGLTLERNNVNGMYELDNCRWATWQDQFKNKTDSVFLEYNGERMIMADWSKRLGIDNRTIHARIKIGWSVERALSTPILKTWNRRP